MKPLFILPFDHRSGLTHELFQVAYPPNAAVAKKITALKNLIFESFLLVYKHHRSDGELSILVDEEFGSSILDRAQRLNIPYAVSTEKSGGSTFGFIHGKGFGRALLKRNPHYAKALVNYTVHDTVFNEEKMEKLRELSDFCREENIPLMLEPIVHGKKSAASLAAIMMHDMFANDIHPALWKLEAMPSVRDWQKVAKIARAPMIVLGHGESQKTVDAWVKIAAQSKVVQGFAIGRTIFFDVIQKYHQQKITKPKAIEMIAKNYTHYITLWKKYS